MWKAGWAIRRRTAATLPATLLPACGGWGGVGWGC